MSRKYLDSFRGYLIDHHSPDPPAVQLGNIDYREYEEAIKQARVDQLMVYCKDHWGSAYYPTNVGRQHPSLTSDYVGEMLAICKRLNIEFMAYYSLGFDEYAISNHPEWGLRNEHGSIIRVERISGVKWHWLCGNTGYRDHCFRYIEEIIRKYRPDSLMLDQVDPEMCYCDRCRALFLKRYGVPMPTDRAAQDHLWRDLLEFSLASRYDFLQSVIGCAKEVDPDIAVSINGGHISLTREVLDLVDWVYAEPWCRTDISACFARGFDQHTQIGPGTVSTVYDPPPRSIFQLETARIVSQGCRCFMFSPTQKPDGSLANQEFELIGEAYGEIAKYQITLKDRTPVADVGVVYSEKSRLFDRQVSHKDCLEQALIVLSQSMYPFRVVPEWDLAQIASSVRVLILPNVSCMSAEFVPFLEDFVAGGGTIICSGETSLYNEKGERLGNFQLARLFGCDYQNTNTEYLANLWGSYLERDGDAHEIWNGLPATDLPALPPYVQVRASTNTEVLARHILPCVAVTDSRWVNWWAPPPKYRTDHPAVCCSKHGYGKSFYLSFRFFGTIPQTLEKHTKFFKIGWMARFMENLLRNILPVPSIRVVTSFPRALGCTFFRSSDGARIFVHQVNQSIEALGGGVNPIEGGEVMIRKSFFQPHTARLMYPETKKLIIEETEQEYCLRAPAVSIHNIIVLE